MKKYTISICLKLLFFLLIVNIYLFANNHEKVKNKKPNITLQKTAYNPYQSLLNTSNITTWVTQEGFHDWIVGDSWNGAFPNGYNVGAIFSEGIVWGGIVNDGSLPSVRVNGNTYSTGCSPLTRIFRVRPDYLTVDLTSDAATFFDISIQQVTQYELQALKDQYNLDWNEWPANEGAPFKDVDHDGIYNPWIDIPGVPGASQTIFIKYNDAWSESNYGSPPIGLEIFETYWTYSNSGRLSDIIFKKVDLVYKGTPTSLPNSKIDSMYIVQWSDPDVGTSTDDFAGCDTSLNLGYAYNSKAYDATYAGFGLQVPAVGYSFLQGVSEFTGNPEDSARFNFKWRKAYKYINRKPMSSFIYFAANGAWWDPDFNYDGTLQFYNLMRGYQPRPAYPFSDEFPSAIADVTVYGTYLLSGDPVSQVGKIDGLTETAGDRRIMIVNGPISMKLGDTAEVVIAEIASMPKDNTGLYNLSSVQNLKEHTILADAVANGKLLAVLSGPEIVVVGTQANFSANYFPVEAELISSDWSITKRPNGSNAQLNNITELATSFTADISGDYEITFTGNVNGKIVSDTRELVAINNNTPVASLKGDKDQIVWGDSVLVDYSQSFDADNDSLSFNLLGNGLFRKDIVNKKAYFLPSPDKLGNEKIILMVSDKYSYDTASVNIFIEPKLENITLNYSYLDPEWTSVNQQSYLSGPPYFRGNDSLYVPMSNSLRLYKIFSDSIAFESSDPNIVTEGIWLIKNNLLFGANHNILQLWGAYGRMSIFDLNNSSNRILTDYLPGTNDIYQIYPIDSEIYLKDYSGVLYKIDFSSPSFPIISDYVQLTSFCNLWKSDNEFLYFLDRDINSTYNYYISKINKNNLSNVTNIDLPFSIDCQIQFNNTLFAIKDYTFIDTLYFYEFNDENIPILIKKVYEPSLFPNPNPEIFNYWDWSFYVDKNYLILYQYRGLRIFDISDAKDIKFIGSWYGGNTGFSKKGDNYYITSDLRFANLKNPYSGINKITLPLTGLENNTHNFVPKQFKLEQNYPNPFNPNTKIKYSIPQTSHVQIIVFDVLGSEIETIVKGEKPAGNYEVNFDAARLSSGIYFYQIKAGDFVQTKKMILLK